MEGFILLVILFLVLGAVYGWIAYYRTNRLLQRNEELQTQLNALKTQVLQLKLDGSRPKSQAVSASSIDTAQVQAEAASPPAQSPITPQPPAPATERWTEPAKVLPAVEPPWLSHLKTNWMVWMGGLCVALAGVFLVRYSIEQGLLGPTARIAAGLLTGLALHAAAEWLRRTRETHIVFAALAGGGSITLFAALLSALHLYQLLSPVLVFALLALVSLVSMLLALVHGPVLAILGILGAYLVPLLVGGDSGSATIVLGYTLIISAATLMLMAHVQRQWLWWAALAGGLLWWLLTLAAIDVDQWRGFYLAALAYLFLSLPQRDWLLQSRDTADDGLSMRSLFADTGGGSLLPLTLLLLILAQGLSLAVQGFGATFATLNWLVLPALLLWTAGRREWLGLHLWCSLLLQVAALLLSQWQASGLALLDGALHVSFQQFCLVMALLFSGLSLFNLRQARNKALWISLAVMAPLACLALSWLLTGAQQFSLQWSLLAATLGALYLAVAGVSLKRDLDTLSIAWLFIGGHVGYSLAVSMYFREAGLTLALALQIVSLGWVIRRFSLTELDFVLKLVVMTVLLRLSLNPWVFAYAERVAWPLWTYAGATLCCLAGSYFLQQRPRLQAWTIGAFIHLLALTLWVVLRYMLYDGDVFGPRYELTEAALNQNLLAALGLIYHWRTRFSEHLKQLCQFYAKALLLLALLNFTAIMLGTLGSHPWVWTGIGSTPVFNLLLLSHGAPILVFYCCARFYLPQLRKPALVLCALSAFVFISLEIMHLWRGNIRVEGSMSDAELYTYSAVWLLMAFAAILGGAWRFGQVTYRAGMALLCLVIAKLFLVDMAGLSGLLRVASFMGMGLVLLATAYLYQKLERRGGQLS